MWDWLLYRHLGAEEGLAAPVFAEALMEQCRVGRLRWLMGIVKYWLKFALSRSRKHWRFGLY